MAGHVPNARTESSDHVVEIPFVVPDRTITTLHGHNVAYVDAPGDGTPVVLVHGVGSHADTWVDIPARVADRGRRAIAVDLIGHGQSALGNGDFSLGANASTIRDLLDQLGIERVHLAGHSLGGGVSMQFAYQYPHRVASLTLVSSGGLGRDVAFALRAAAVPGAGIVLGSTLRPGTVRTVARIGDRLHKWGWRSAQLSPRVIDKLNQLGDRQQSHAFLSTLRSVVGHDGQRVSALDKLKAVDPERVMIIWGGRDSIMPQQHGRDAHELLPGSRFVVIDDAGHHAHSHDPARFAELLIEHLAEVDSRDRRATVSPQRVGGSDQDEAISLPASN